LRKIARRKATQINHMQIQRTGKIQFDGSNPRSSASRNEIWRGFTRDEELAEADAVDLDRAIEGVGHARGAFWLRTPV